MASVNVSNLCLKCMNMLPHPKAVCPYCGWSRQTDQGNAISQLTQGITLTNPTNGNKYLIGKAVGQGGFGIVYVAFDLKNNRKVAIKEYFPTQFVNRTHSGTVIPINDTPVNRAFLARQKKRFYQEAQKMHLFHDSPNVVDVLDYFETDDQNTNTAYIVMEFIEGQTLADVLSRQPNERLPLQTVLANLKPIVNILERIHHTPYNDDKGVQHPGITHRDISPENIMYASDGTVKLLDFGAARVSDPGDPPTGIIKPGYAPPEQELVTSGEQGAWTDVYALAATIYRAVTGQIPLSATNRMGTDSLIQPHAMGIQITPQEEKVLLKGLALKTEDRYQSVGEFYNDFFKPVEKAPPILSISAFTKNGDNYNAIINYNGDGMLTTNVGFINGNNLFVQSATGDFNGIITATEGAKFSATATQFRHEREHVDSPWKKIAWAVAAVAVIAAFLMLNKVKAHEIELANVQKQIQANEEQLEKYRDFAADYGYGSSSYYAEKAIVFVGRNSEARVSIYCDLLSGELHATMITVDGEDLINAKWEAAFNEEHKANVIIKTGDTRGFSTLHFTNEANDDNFDVLVVVQ